MIAELPDWLVASPASFLVGVIVGLVLAGRRYRIVRTSSDSEPTHHTVEVSMSVQDPRRPPQPQPPPEADPTAPGTEPGTEPAPEPEPVSPESPGIRQPESEPEE